MTELGMGRAGMTRVCSVFNIPGPVQPKNRASHANFISLTMDTELASERRAAGERLHEV